MVIRRFAIVSCLAMLCVTPWAGADDLPENSAMFEIELPESDVVSADKPLVIRVNPKADGGSVAVDAIELTVQSRGGGKAITFAAPAAKAGGALTLSLDAAPLAPGEYVATLVVRSGNAAVKRTTAFYRVPTELDDPFPFGIYAVPLGGQDDAIDERLREVASFGLNFISNHTHDLSSSDVRVWDRTARTSIRMRPSIRYWSRDGKPAPAGQHHILADGKELEKTWCYHQPAFLESAVGHFETHLRSYTTHPAFDDAAFFGDDMFVPAKPSNGHANLACYCDTCKAAFKKATGLDAPTTTDTPRAVLDDADPWLQWMRFRCADHYGNYIKAIDAARQRVDPALEVGLAHGAPDQPFVEIVRGLYGPLTQKLNVVSSYNYPFLRSPAADLIVHYEIGRMGNRDKPIWQLGVCAADNTACPAWQVNQNYWNMLAAGYDCISFFSWWDFAGIASKRPADEQPRLKEAMDALKRCGAHKDWVLPIAKHWQREAARFAVLYSFTTESFDIAPEFRGTLHNKAVSRVVREALKRELPVDVISEEEIQDGILDRYQAVCLPDARHVPGSVSVKLHEYVAAGGKAFVDADYRYIDPWKPRVKFPLKGAFEAAPETMAQMLADMHERAVVVSNDDISTRRFVAGDASYVVLVNNYPDRYWGMAYTYGDPQANYSKADLVKDLPVDTTVRFSAAGQHVFDVSTGEHVGATDDELAMTIEPSWGRVLMVLPTKTVSLSIDAPDSIAQGESATIGIRMQDEAGEAIRAAFAAKVTLTAPDGSVDPRSSYVSLDNGKRALTLPIGINAPTGTWTLTVEGGFPRKTITHKLKVSATSAKPDLLSVTGQ